MEGIALFVTNAARNSMYAFPICMAITTLSGAYGAKGRVKLTVSVVSGLILGGFSWLATVGVPQDLAGYFQLFLAALVPGLVAAGVYDTGKAIVGKALDGTNRTDTNQPVG